MSKIIRINLDFMISNLQSDIINDSRLSIPQELLQFISYSRPYITSSDHDYIYNKILTSKNLLIAERRSSNYNIEKQQDYYLK